MTDIFGRKKGQPVNWFHRKPEYSNHYCLYCGTFVGPNSAVESDKEHLIGRNFVPTGSLDKGGFNFIFRSCTVCNKSKADAERHVSSITLFNSPGRADDACINALAEHKASSDYHPDKRGVLVREAKNDFSVEFAFGPARMKFDVVSPPQANLDFVKLLACNHVQGLFALLTTEEPRVREKSRVLPANQVWFHCAYGYQDWGNRHLSELSKRVAEWPCYANIDTAGRFFKAILKRGEEREANWFWALEWNRYLRVVGAIGHPERMPEVVVDLPAFDWKPLPDGSGRFREEEPLSNDSAPLFSSTIMGSGEEP